MSNTLNTKEILKANGIKESDINLFFDLVDKSLKYDDFFNCATQQEEFLKLCYMQSKEKRVTFSKIITALEMYFYNDNQEFNKMHWSEGGIIEGGDDAFYDDFACWLIFRGIEVLDNFLKNGAKYLIDYIKSLNISNDELTYENFRYHIDADYEDIDVESFKKFSELETEELESTKNSIDLLLRLRKKALNSF